VPPAACTASTAPEEAPVTSMVTGEVIAPLARTRMPSRDRRSTPEDTRMASVIGWPASILPASMNFWIRPRLTTVYSLRLGLLKPRFGSRM
jgi:hypothetical protein